MTGVIYHDLFGKHLEGYPHVESPERYRSVIGCLRKSAFLDELSFIEAEPAKIEWIKAVHDYAYVDAILSLEINHPIFLDAGDTVATHYSIQAALHSAGAGVQAAGMVLEGKLASAFCAGRPPGHHAERDRAMGFCIFNNIAITASWLLNEGGVDRVAIVDWDVHHGNGTENIFLDDDRVFYISLHQYPHYPGSGHLSTVGTGIGTGYNLNIPVESGVDDSVYISRFNEQVIPALEGYKPGFILISAGFDAHAEDPLSGGLLSSSVFGEMTRLLKSVADRHCGGRIVSLLEGGYNLEALAESVEKHVEILVTDTSCGQSDFR